MEQGFQIGYFWRLIMVLLRFIRWIIFLLLWRAVWPTYTVDAKTSPRCLRFSTVVQYHLLVLYYQERKSTNLSLARVCT
jgi:hypothetical protein